MFIVDWTWIELVVRAINYHLSYGGRPPCTKLISLLIDTWKCSTAASRTDLKHVPTVSAPATLKRSTGHRSSTKHLSLVAHLGSIVLRLEFGSDCSRSSRSSLLGDDRKDLVFGQMESGQLPIRESLASAMRHERKLRSHSSSSQSSKAPLIMGFLSCLAWLYVAGRLDDILFLQF